MAEEFISSAIFLSIAEMRLFNSQNSRLNQIKLDVIEWPTQKQVLRQKMERFYR
jgi:hypothetical protein